MKALENPYPYSLKSMPHQHVITCRRNKKDIACLTEQFGEYAGDSGACSVEASMIPQGGHIASARAHAVPCICTNSYSSAAACKQICNLSNKILQAPAYEH